MLKLKLNSDEERAISELKSTINSRYNLLQFKLFGSKARGVSSEDSDIDLFIVLEKCDWEIEKNIYELCFEIGLKYDLLLSPVIYSRKETEDRLTQITPFYKMVDRDGISI